MICAHGAAAERPIESATAGHDRGRDGTALVVAAIGSELRDYELDVANGELTQKNSTALPATIQAGSLNPAGHYALIAWSDGTNVTAGSQHRLGTLRIDPATLALAMQGVPIPLPSRPIYVSTDPTGRHALISYTSPSGVTVHDITPDGAASMALTQPPLELGTYAHQVVVDPAGRTAILVARGNLSTTSRHEDPGALDTLNYVNGHLASRGSVAPNGGVGFHPRYVGFHPTRPWLFVSLSQQNQLGVFQRSRDGKLNATAVFEANSLADPTHVRPGQLTGALHVHPSGRFVYLANRAVSSEQVDGKPVFTGGENSIAVFAIDPKTGRPTLIQDADTHGMGPVEFALDPSGKVLVVANMTPLWVRAHGTLEHVPPSLVTFRVGEDGKLEFLQRSEVEQGGHTLFWLGVSALPQGAPSSSRSDLQRSYQMDHYTELTEHGSARGESIYFYKCFVCHNQYAKGGPALEGLFHRGRSIVSGPATEASVRSFISQGTDTMPGFGAALTAADMEDLLDYLKTPHCCYEAEDPPANPQYLARAHKWPVSGTLRGGAHGLVYNSKGEKLAGIRVQLIAPNGVRTTVISDASGRYEFPMMPPGDYLLRIATSLPYTPYERSDVRVNANDTLADIVLDKLPQAAEGALPGALPATDEVASQLSGSELLWNLPGSLTEKTAFLRTCGIGCHDLKEVLRNRFDERGWRTITTWMTSRGSASAFMVRPPVPKLTPDAEIVVKWLTRVRGPGSKDDVYRAYPRASRLDTDVVVTEFELPRRFLSIHEVAGDSKGRIWYTSHRTPYFGVLDPRTGVVEEYRVPEIPGTFPGTHKVTVGRDDAVWLSQNWAHRLTRFDAATGRFKQLFIQTKAPLNAGSWGNFSLAPDGFLWSEHDDNTIVRIDPDSGKIVNTYPLAHNPNPSDDLVSADGRFWAGGAPTMGGNTAMLLDIASGKMYETNSGDIPSSAARGGFDPAGNAWFGGHMGSLVELVNRIDRGEGIEVRTFTPPTPYFPYSSFYSVLPDKKGDVWMSWVHGTGLLRFTPATATWRFYPSAEPSAFARSTWIDNSTDPVTVWYPDYQMGTLVRVQPRD